MNGDESRRIYDKLDKMSSHISNRIDSMHGHFDKRFDQHRAQVEQKIDNIEDDVIAVKSDYSAAKKLIIGVGAIWTVAATYFGIK